MSEVTLHLDTEQWDRFLDSISGKLGLATDRLLTLGKIHGFQDVVDHFKNEEGPTGKWSKRAKSTQDRYARINAGLQNPPAGTARAAFNPSNKLLQLTGTLRQSISPQQGKAKKRSKGMVELFTEVSYASAHEYGTKNIPQRSFMWLSKSTKKKYSHALSLFGRDSIFVKLMR